MIAVPLTRCRFNELLATNRLYKNPYACHNMVLLYDINEYSSLCCDFSFPPEQNYERIRAVQNQKWAEQRLLRGVEYAKEGKFAEAVRCYSEAIDLVPKYAEAYTARGAAFFFPTSLMRRLVKMGKYKESVTNFETALHIDEKTPNAKQYLERALAMQQGRPSIRTSELLTPAPALKPVVPSVKTTEIDKHLLELMQKDRSRSRSSHKRHHHSHDSNSREHSHEGRRHSHHHHSPVCNKHTHYSEYTQKAGLPGLASFLRFIGSGAFTSSAWNTCTSSSWQSFLMKCTHWSSTSFSSNGISVHHASLPSLPSVNASSPS